MVLVIVVEYIRDGVSGGVISHTVVEQEMELVVL